MAFKLKLEDILSVEEQIDIATTAIEMDIENIRSGQTIKKPYAKSTMNKRHKYGLQVSYVDLTGNDEYSKKSYRFLDDWNMVSISKYRFKLVWKHELSAKLYGIHSSRYGKLFRS